MDKRVIFVLIGNAGKYVVLPRTTAIQAAMKELEYQMSGATAEEEAKTLGRAVNAEYVLSAEARSLGSSNMISSGKRMENTAGPSVNLWWNYNNGSPVFSGEWDY